MNVVPKTMVAAAGLAWFATTVPLAVAADDTVAPAAIRAASTAFLNAYNAGDADAVVTHFEESAVVMPPGALTVRGRAEIRQFVEKASQARRRAESRSRWAAETRSAYPATLVGTRARIRRAKRGPRSTPASTWRPGIGRGVNGE
jgi:hypothetical protein